MESELDQGILSYLQAYPYPALVVDTTTRHPSHLRDVQWSNPSWKALSTGRPLNSTVKHECLDSFWTWVDSGTETVHELVIGRPLVVLRLVRVPRQSTFTVITSLNSGEPSPAARASRSPLASSHTPTLRSPTPPRDPLLTDCATLLKNTDWSATSLGPRKTWSPVLETMISIVMRSPTQDALWLGSDAIMLYNQHYSQIVKHPLMFGKSAKLKEAWGPVWPSISALIDKCLAEGEPCFFEDDLLLYHVGPTGHFVEKYHTWSFIPIYDYDKTPLGIYNPTRETTSAVLASRRQNTLQAFAETLAPTRTSEDFFEGIAKAAQPNARDMPFLMCYSIGELPSGELQLSLESAVGIESTNADNPNRPKDRPSSRTLRQPFVARETDDWPFEEALAKQDWTIVKNCRRMIQDFPLRQWDELPEAAIMIPIYTDLLSNRPRSLLIIGLNLLCPFDYDYQEWIRLLRSLLASSMRSVEAHLAEQQRRSEQERLDRAKTAWFQGAAHDLRTPLTLVAGPLDDVLGGELTPTQRHSLNLAQRNVTRIQRLTNALLDFSRIEAGKLEGRFTPTDLSIFVTDIAALFRPAIERMRIKFDIDVQEYNGNVVVDPTLFETVVTNLLSNALKYTEHGRIGVRLSFDTCAELVITDTGIGIASSDFDTVTDRFSRAGSGKTRAIEGTGIGLALVKKIVRLHGGEFGFKSKTQEEGGVDHGSVFTVRIPLSRPHSAAELADGYTFGRYSKQLAAEAMYRASPAEDSEPPESPSFVERQEDEFMFESTDVLLVVDDTADMRQYLSQLFKPYCKVVTARNGEEALQIAQASPPQLVLSDLMMPKVDGQQLLSVLRSDPSTQLIPVILLSASTDEESRLAAYNAGAEDFMLKPFRPRELIARVHLHMALGKRRLALEKSFASREQELKVLSDYCPSGIVRTNDAGKVVYANAAWLKYSGMTEHDDPNNWASQLEPESLPRLLVMWDELLRGDRDEIIVSWKWRTGTISEGRFLRLDRIHSGMTGILGCLQDKSYQEERFLEAERRRREAEESRRQQELLVDLTSHEIRTPVSAILQCSSLVKSNMSTLKVNLLEAKSTGFLPSPELFAEIEEDLGALESIYQCGLVQERIAADILSLGRIQVGSLSLYNTERDIISEARKVLAVFASELKMKNIQLELKPGATLARLSVSTLTTDHVRLGQVVTNLVSNAIRFTASSHRRLITVTYEVSSIKPEQDTCELPKEDQINHVSLGVGSPVWLFVSVKDTGPGLGPKELKRLFLRFSQASDMIHSQYGGSGLGLYICKKITELLDGRIEVLSELGNGSDFRFFVECRMGANIPSKTSSGANFASISMDSLHQALPSQSDLGIGSSSDHSRLPTSKIVLIVEDNIINQTVLKRQLVKAGYTCEVADNGVHALEVLERPGFSADVILMDLEMPVMNGFEAVKCIRTWETEGRIPHQAVIALTGNARQWQIDQAMEAGMDDVMIKPYRLPELVKKIDSAILEKFSTAPTQQLQGDSAILS